MKVFALKQHELDIISIDLAITTIAHVSIIVFKAILTEEFPIVIMEWHAYN